MPQGSVCRESMNWRVAEPVAVNPLALFLGAAFIGGVAVSAWEAYAWLTSSAF